MNFTIFLNTRGRVEQFKRCLEIAESKTKDKNLVEFIVKADTDDLETVNFLKSLETRNTFNFKTIISERPESLCSSFNVMAKMATGKYLFVLTDDAEIMTQDWDEIALNKIKAYQKGNAITDDIIYGMTSDTSIDKPKGQAYASFPIISKKAVDVLGIFMYDSFHGFGGDSSIIRVYAGVKRIVDLTEIQLDHVYNNNIFRIMAPDLTGSETRARTQNNPVNPFEFDVSKEVTKLKEFIFFNHHKTRVI